MIDSTPKQARETAQRTGDLATLLVLLAMNLGITAYLVYVGDRLSGWNAMLLIVSMGTWGLMWYATFGVFRDALLNREPDWPERYEYGYPVGHFVEPNVDVARYWIRALAMIMPFVMGGLGIYVYGAVTHTRANDGLYATLLPPFVGFLFCALGLLGFAWVGFRPAQKGFYIEPDEFADQCGGYYEGL